MSVTDSPLQRTAYDPVAWNFKLIAQHTLDGFGGMGEGMSIQIAPDGRRIIWLAHESAPEEFHRGRRLRPAQAEGGLPDRPAAGLHALQFAGDHRPGDGGRLSVPEGQSEARRLRAVRHLEARKAEVDRLCRLLGPAFARRASALVRRWRIRAHGLGRARLRAEPSARRPVLPLLRCAQSVEADGDRPLVAPGTRKGDNEPPPARHQKPALDKGNRAHNTNVYPQRPDRMYLAYLDAGMFIMDISDKSKPKPISRFDNSPPYTGFTHTVVPLFDRGLVIMTDESTVRQCRRLAEADLDPRRPRREQPGSDLDLPDAESGRLQDPRRPLRRAQHPREHAAPDLVEVGPDHPRHVLQRRACAPTTSPTPISRRKSRRSSRRDRRCRSTRRSSSTTCSSTSARSSTRSIASPAGCTSWRWTSDGARTLSLARGRAVRPPAEARARGRGFR